MPRRILVTGASGFVGTHLLSSLAACMPGAQILSAAFDLTDGDAVRGALLRDPPDICIHLAAIAAIGDAQADPGAAWQVNLHGTLDLARSLLAVSPGCVLVFASTADAYGGSFRSGLPATESTPLAPMNVYAATKAAADLALGAMVGEGLRVIRLRPFNHTGPGQSGSFVVPAFARQVARIEAGLQPPVLRVGALDPRRDFLDVRDVCRAYGLCAQRAQDLPAGTILNLASGVSLRVGDVLDTLLAMAGVQAEITTDPDRLRPSDIPVAVGDASAARAMLGWAPEIAWNDTLRDVLDYWREKVRTEEG